jgi:hypothetical protein
VHIVVRTRVEDIEETFASVTNFQHARHVPAAVTVVRRTPDGAQLVVEENLEPLLTQLVRAQVVNKFLQVNGMSHILRAERVPGATRAERELVFFGVGVAPDEVGHGALVGNLAEAVDDLDLVDGVNRGRQAAVHAEDLIVDDDGQGEEVEHVGEVVPHVGVAVLARALGVEAVRLCDATRLVVAADEMDAVRVAQLQAYEERDGLNRKEAAVDIVACTCGQPGARVACRVREAAGVPRNR